MRLTSIYFHLFSIEFAKPAFVRRWRGYRLRKMSLYVLRILGIRADIVARKVPEIEQKCYYI